MNFDEYFAGGMALFGAFLSWFTGDLDGVMKILIAMVVLDQITGVLKGLVLGKFTSDAGFHGIAKKVLIFILVGIANIIDNEMLGKTEVLRDAVCFFYIANEGLSIIENAIEMGAPIPESIKNRFMTWRDMELTGSEGQTERHTAKTSSESQTVRHEGSESQEQDN